MNIFYKEDQIYILRFNKDNNYLYPKVPLYYTFHISQSKLQFKRISFIYIPAVFIEKVHLVHPDEHDLHSVFVDP